MRLALALMLAFATPAFADDVSTLEAEAGIGGVAPAATQAPATQAPAKGDGKAGFATSDKTTIDFSEASIDGAFKAPAGFFLQGRQTQSMTQMVKLRSKFRSELRNSKAAVKSLVK